MSEVVGDPTGLHRVIEPPGVLPQLAHRLDTRRELWPDETRVAVERLNLDAASYRQLTRTHTGAEDLRRAVLDIVAERGKMQNPETGSGGMLIGTVEAVGPEASTGLAVGDRVATLVSLTLTPLVITDGLARWDGDDEQLPCEGYAVLFGRTIAARLPEDLPDEIALSVMDVCGAPALTERVVRQCDEPPVVVVIGGGGKSGSLSLAAARRAGAARTVAVVPTEREAAAVREAAICDEVVLADATDPVATRDAVLAAGGPAHVTVVCVDVPGCEGSAVLATAEGGTVIFFSMATSFSAAALGAEGLAADVTLLIGNGYLPGHAETALELYRQTPGVRRLFEARTQVIA